MCVRLRAVFRFWFGLVCSMHRTVIVLVTSFRLLVAVPTLVAPGSEFLGIDPGKMRGNSVHGYPVGLPVACEKLDVGSNQ